MEISYMLSPGILQLERLNISKGRVGIIEEVVCKHYGISMEKLKSHRRFRELAFARQVCYYLIRKHTTMGLIAIGKRMGGRDHATIISGVRQVRNLMQVDTGIRLQVEAIEEKILKCDK